MKYRLKNPQMDELLRKNFTAEEIDKTIEKYKATEVGIVHFNMGKDDGYYLFSFSVRDVEEVTNPQNESGSIKYPENVPEEEGEYLVWMDYNVWELEYWNGKEWEGDADRILFFHDLPKVPQ